jgi:hypothetical protein
MKTFALSAVLVCALAGTASAKQLGEQGAKSINGAFQLALTSTSNSKGGDDQLEIRVAPNGDLFVAPSVSLGGGIVVDYLSQGDSSATAIGLQGRVGYYLPLASLGLWPQAGLYYVHVKTDPAFGEGSSFDLVGLQLYVPIVVHLTSNFFFGFGPSLDQELNDDDDDGKSRVLGLTSMVGGAW